MESDNVNINGYYYSHDFPLGNLAICKPPPGGVCLHLSILVHTIATLQRHFVLEFLLHVHSVGSCVWHDPPPPPALSINVSAVVVALN